MIGQREIAAATSANDAASDRGEDHEQIFADLGVDLEGVQNVATNRALKAIGVLFWGDPDHYATLEDLIATGDPGQLTTLSTLAGCFMDGMAAGLRISAGRGA